MMKLYYFYICVDNSFNFFIVYDYFPCSYNFSIHSKIVDFFNSSDLRIFMNNNEQLF